jgi:hypothetical protein
MKSRTDSAHNKADAHFVDLRNGGNLPDETVMSGLHYSLILLASGLVALGGIVGAWCVLAIMQALGGY